MTEGIIFIRSQNDRFRKTPDHELFKIHYSYGGAEAGAEKTLTLTLQNKDGSSVGSKELTVNDRFNEKSFVEAVEARLIVFRISAIFEAALSDKNIATVWHHIGLVLQKQQMIASTQPIFHSALTAFSASGASAGLSAEEPPSVAKLSPVVSSDAGSEEGDSSVSDASACDAMKSVKSTKRSRGAFDEPIVIVDGDSEIALRLAQRQRTESAGDRVSNVNMQAVRQQLWKPMYFRSDKQRPFNSQECVVCGVLYQSHPGYPGKLKVYLKIISDIDLHFSTCHSGTANRDISKAFIFVLAKRMSEQTLDTTRCKENIIAAWFSYDLKTREYEVDGHREKAIPYGEILATMVIPELVAAADESFTNAMRPMPAVPCPNSHLPAISASVVAVSAASQTGMVSGAAALSVLPLVLSSTGMSESTQAVPGPGSGSGSCSG